MSEPQFDEQTLRSSLADIKAGMVRYMNWFNGERPRDAYDLIHHAWMQGAYVGSLETGVASMNCYGQRQYRMAWFAGFDIAKRIRACSAELTQKLECLREMSATCGRQEARIAELERTLQEMPDEQVSAWQLGAKLLAAQNRIAELEQLKLPIGDDTDMLHQQASAWNKVWQALGRNGIFSFVPQNYDGKGVTRAVEYIDRISADLKTHLHLVRTMGERCDVLGGLLLEVLNVEKQIGPNDTVVGPNTKLVEKIERALAQGGSE